MEEASIPVGFTATRVTLPVVEKGKQLGNPLVPEGKCAAPSSPLAMIFIRS